MAQSPSVGVRLVLAAAAVLAAASVETAAAVLAAAVVAAAVVLCALVRAMPKAAMAEIDLKNVNFIAY
jgi:hypothetical protein